MTSNKDRTEILKSIHDAVVEFEEEKCEQFCRDALETGIDANDAIMNGLSAGMDTVGKLYENEEYFVPELLLCSDALYAGLDVLRPHVALGQELGNKGRLLIGVIEGDIHDIGKGLVKTMFEAAGWEICDLGKDVKLGKFVEEQEKFKPDLVAISALMTTSMLAMPKVIKMLKEKDPEVFVMIGGAPLNSDIATVSYTHLRAHET